MVHPISPFVFELNHSLIVSYFTIGADRKGNELRNRLYWKCKHCNEVQFAGANPENKASHLQKRHTIVKDGNQVPTSPMDRYIQPGKLVSKDIPVVIGRQKEAYKSLTATIRRKPFLDALITLLVVCQLAFTLATNHLFIAFLKTVFPTIEELLPKSAHTIRKYVLLAFEKRKEVLKAAIRRSSTQIHFSFDLWTSPNHLALLGIVGHYIDEFGCNRSVCTLFPFTTYFTSQLQFRYISDLLRF